MRTRLLAAVIAMGCTGSADLQLPELSPEPIELPSNASPGVSGIRRLTRVEYDATLGDLLGEPTSAGSTLLPADSTDPFDNDYRTQQASAMLIDAAEKLATDAAARAFADPARRLALVGCVPTGPNDADCLRRFVSTFGRRALRRPLTEEEVQRYLALGAYSVEANDFYVGAQLVVRAMLQDPEFLYRVEIGTPTDRPGIYRLTPFELASRLSYTLWGSMPPDWLFDAAERGQLSSKAQIRAAAERLLADHRARARVRRFHALWLGYHKLPHPLELTIALQAESDALVERVVFDERGDYFDLFRSTETYVDRLLAEHYGLPSPAAQGWVAYGSTGRQGILSHGAVLSAGAKFDDTSPTQRGIFVRNRLLCQEVPPPPPNVNVDEKPTNPTSNCKVDRYAAHASVGNCKSCHQSFDPIGFGLENYDRAGRYRAHDLNEPSCLISGDGQIAEVGPFKGPAGLSDLLVSQTNLDRCVVTQVFRFTMGRRELPGDLNLIDELSERFKQKNRPFAELLVDFVSGETFAFRAEE